jgi:hypothetical protein
MDTNKLLSFEEWNILTQEQKEAIYGIPTNSYYLFISQYITDWSVIDSFESYSLGYQGYCNWYLSQTDLMKALKEDNEL